MPDPGRALIDHLRAQIPGVDNATIAAWAGVTRQRVTDWDNQRARGGPVHAEVVQLGRAAQKQFPHHRVSPYHLLKVAGF